MTADIKKIRSDIPADPKMLLGMLLSHVDQIRELAIVVVWDNDVYQMVNTPMKFSERAMCSAVMEKHLLDELGEKTE